MVHRNRFGERRRCCLAPALVLAALAGAVSSAGASAVPVEEVRGKIEAAGPHPRLFLPGPEMERVRRKIEKHPLLGGVWTSILRAAEEMLELPPSERIQVGRRLLATSRTALKRVGYLAFAYRMTGNPAYLRRAEAEMLAAARFSDWNPTHFLDVAEMTAALAIGYDWLYEDLGEAARREIRDAIIEKGLQASFDRPGGWVTGRSNWAQVCHGGLTLGALAVLEDEPDLAERVIVRALENIHRPMDAYGPNGAYPEGAGYWSYGTSYNVLFIDALESALGDDFGLSGHERFMASARYYLHVHGPTTQYFNYSDNRAEASVAEASYWFARRLGQPELLWMERRKLEDFLKSGLAAGGSGHRLLPFLLVWAEALDGIRPPEELHYADEGATPVGVHRSGWDERAVYVGLKGGTPDAPHGQMDVGTFVMESHGVRWALDLGLQDYHSLESAGIDLWNRAQDSQRWTVFRLNNHSKNTLVVDGQLQRVDAFAPVIDFSRQPSRSHTIVDMTEVYAGQLAAARRGVSLTRGGTVVVQDELEAEREVEVRWGMLTEAEVEILGAGRALLRQQGEKLGLRVAAPEKARLEIYDTANPPREHDAPNPGTRMIGFKVRLGPGEAARLVVRLIPGGLEDGSPLQSGGRDSKNASVIRPILNPRDFRCLWNAALFSATGCEALYERAGSWQRPAAPPPVGSHPSRDSGPRLRSP